MAEEVLKSNFFIMPDGISRQGAGEIAGSVVKVDDRIRALKAVQMSSGIRENWATTLVYMLDRLATAGNTEVDTVWHNLSAFLSDLCKVNLHLAEEVKTKIGSV